MYSDTLSPATRLRAVYALLLLVACIPAAGISGSIHAAEPDWRFQAQQQKVQPAEYVFESQIAKPRSANPFLGYLRKEVTPDYATWTEILEAKAKALREQESEALAALGYSPTALVSVVEAGEMPGTIGINDTPGTAQHIDGFGTGPGDDPEADVTGNLQPGSVAPTGIALNAEEDGDINSGTVTGLGSNAAITASGTIGDSIYGRSGIVSTVIDVSVEPNGTPAQANDTGITNGNTVIETTAQIGDGAFGSSGTGEGDFDFYLLPAPDGLQYFELLVARADGETEFRPVLGLFDPNGNFVQGYDDTGQQGSISIGGEVNGPPGTWFLAVGGNFNLDGIPDANDFPTDPSDPTTGPGAGSEGSYTLQLTYPTSGDFDVLSFVATAGDRVVVEVDTDASSPGELDPIVALFNDAGEIPVDGFGNLAINDDDPTWSPPDSQFDSLLAYTIPETGTYHAFIGGFSLFPTSAASFPSDPTDASTGPWAVEEGPYDVTISLFTQDVDVYSFDLTSGDIVAANILGPSANLLGLFAPDGGTQLALTPFDTNGVHPPEAPFPLGGNSSLSYLANDDGTYSMAVFAGADDYTLELRAYRPPQEESLITQRLFLDYDGASVDTSKFGSTLDPATQPATLSPLADFLVAWGLGPTDEDAVIDAINATVEQRLSAYIEQNGLSNAFRVDILNSRDHPDVWGEPDVSRIIIGGTIAESGIDTIGIAESIDLGNFNQAEDGLVLLDELSDTDAGNPNSLNSLMLDAGVTIIDLIGDGVGKIAAHEAGHFFANWHTSRVNPTFNIMDEGGDLPALVGVGADGIWGSGDDIDVNFTDDVFSTFESFSGTSDSLNNIAYGLPGQPKALPLLVSLPDVTSDSIEDIGVVRAGSALAEIRSGANGALQRVLTYFGNDFTPLTAAALPDADGNGVAELAVLATRDADGRIAVEIRNLSGAEAPRTVYFAPDHTPVAMTVIDGDADDNGVPELAVLSRRNSDGRGLVEVKNAFGPTNPRALWAGAGLTASDVEVVPDADANGVPEVAILSTRDADGRIVAEIKNAAGPTLPSAVWFAPGHTAIDLTVVPDKDSNGVPEVASLSSRDADGRILVEIKNAAGATQPSAVWFAPGHTALEVAAVNDADSNGVPEVAVLSTRDADGRILVEVKNAAGATNPNPVWYSAGFTARDLATIADTDSNGIDEALVLMIRDADGRILVQGRNTAGNPVPNNYWFSP